MELNSLSDIFTKRIFRIPDYQRGYSWESNQLKDFWEDINHLESNKIHYTGLLTLEPVPETIYAKWEQDIWVMKKGFKPFYIVDGQQRLTTCVILIQAIIEKMESDFDKKTAVNEQSLDEIRDTYILHKANITDSKSFIFGYEKDNPSDEFLRKEIFKTHIFDDSQGQTLYTKNLSEAKTFFLNKLRNMSLPQIEIIFEKLTQRLKFNLYKIDDEIDVFVTFETMNNRGKPLTTLELLKNRLIYLSTLFKDDESKAILRKDINDTWKTIYDYLGKNAEEPLDDDEFLKNHWIMYYKYSRGIGEVYKNYLLNEKFSSNNVTHPDKEDDRLSIVEISDYIKNLQEAAKYWFYIHNPYYHDSNFDEESKKLLDRLKRLNFKHSRPLILATYITNQDVKDIKNLLRVTERYNFVVYDISQRRADIGNIEFFGYALKLLWRKIQLLEIIINIKDMIGKYYDPNKFLGYISDKYKIKREGFYGWRGLRYFLYEYEQYLQENGKQYQEKIKWQEFMKSKSDYETMEHILPQDISDGYWQEHYGNPKFNDDERMYLTHSLGNFLPLSRPKNSTMRNYSFDKKKNNGNGVGYYNGSAAENELSLYENWLADDILNRGMKLLKFMEDRWEIEIRIDAIGKNEFKRRLLHLDFIGGEIDDSEAEDDTISKHESNYIEVEKQQISMPAINHKSVDKPIISNKRMLLKRELQTVGIKDFINWLEYCIENPTTKSEVITKIYKEQPHLSFGSCGSKIGTIYQIIRDNHIKEALYIVVTEVKKISPELKIKAKELYEKYS
ncbi:MAG: DUF262 domain-containing HNH endonuclease family protein [Alphaproteobacteria bacterium]|nr:DUF262 domain-containing HNH endonuclease family protein [Alphaproteobacteria bacterium]